MNPLTPSEAVAVVNGAYPRPTHPLTALRERQEPIGNESLFIASARREFAGKRGGLMVSGISGLGDAGVGAGRYADGLLIAIKCTKITLDKAQQLDPGGRPAHGEFNAGWKSVAPDICAMVRGRNSTHGRGVSHGPGGAVAAPNADFRSASAAADQGGGAAANESLRVKSWLENSASVKGGQTMAAAMLLTTVGKAMKWRLAKGVALVMGGVGVALTASAKVLDQLAWLPGQATSLSKEIGGQIKGLVGAIFRFLGRTLIGVINVTGTFVRWVLELLFQSLRTVAMQALALVT